jgi:lipoate-protein ligase B
MTGAGIITKPTARIIDLGQVDYEAAHAMQLQFVEQRVEGNIEDTFVFVTHPPTITIGRGSAEENVLVSDEVLAQRGVRKHEVERGGDVTFHGPGQQVIYPIIDLERRGRDLHQFLRDLESVVIAFLENHDLKGERIPGKTGVWIEGKKICAIGIAVRRWVSFHGLALNLDTDLSYFRLIKPCGFHSESVTSLQALTGAPIEREAIFFQLTNAIREVFQVELSL